MEIRYASQIATPAYCSGCGIKQTFKDKIHVCDRQNDPGHRNNAYLIQQNEHLIGNRKLIICWRCRWRNKDKSISWEVKRNYWKRKVRNVKNEPQYDKYHK